MAIGTDIDVQVTGRGSCLKSRPTRAMNRRFFVRRMDAPFHSVPLIFFFFSLTIV
jgi:hypothetical protein